MMKSVVILFDDKKSKYSLEKAFDGKSSVDLSKNWADSVSSKLNCSLEIVSGTTLTEILENICEICNKNQYETVIFAFNDCPFLNVEITEKLFSFHTTYKSEYTFTDGYPYGLSPEVIHAGTLKILLELSKTTQKALGDSEITKESLFNLIKTDINSFEVETLMAPEDWRLLRLNLDCSKKENFLSCKALYSLLNGNIQTPIAEISDLASKSPAVLKTVPGFYNIQISGKVCSDLIYSPYNKLAAEQNYKPVDFMDFKDYSNLVEKIADFSGNAVIGLSAWADPLLNPQILNFIEKTLKYDGLSVFIETDGQNISDEFCTELKRIYETAKPRTNGWSKIMIAVCIDAFTQNTYKQIHQNSKDEAFSQAVSSIEKLRTAIGDNVYPQFTRMNQNEEELESFFRYWKESSNTSGGNLIIQKYDDLAGILPECKPADLSPIDRNPCWHLRRDITILLNGDVPMCRQCIFKNIIGNVFKNSLEEIWEKNTEILKNHIEKKYDGICGKCDESYTFYF